MFKVAGYTLIDQYYQSLSSDVDSGITIMPNYWWTYLAYLCDLIGYHIGAVKPAKKLGPY